MVLSCLTGHRERNWMTQQAPAGVIFVTRGLPRTPCEGPSFLVVTDGDHQLPPVVTVGPVAQGGGSLGQSRARLGMGATHTAHMVKEARGVSHSMDASGPPTSPSCRTGKALPSTSGEHIDQYDYDAPTTWPRHRTARLGHLTREEGSEGGEKVRSGPAQWRDTTRLPFEGASDGMDDVSARDRGPPAGPDSGPEEPLILSFCACGWLKECPHTFRASPHKSHKRSNVSTPVLKVIVRF